MPAAWLDCFDLSHAGHLGWRRDGGLQPCDLVDPPCGVGVGAQPLVDGADRCLQSAKVGWFRDRETDVGPAQHAQRFLVFRAQVFEDPCSQTVRGGAEDLLFFR